MWAQKEARGLGGIPVALPLGGQLVGSNVDIYVQTSCLKC